MTMAVMGFGREAVEMVRASFLGRGARALRGGLRPRFNFQTASLATRATQEAGTAKALKPFSAIPGPARLPGLGAVQVVAPYMAHGGICMRDLLLDLHNEYGPIVRFKVGPQDIVFVFDDAFLDVLGKDTKDPVGIIEQFWTIMEYNKKFNVCGGKINPFMDRGENWKQGRKAVAPMLFATKAAKSYVESINAATRSSVACVENYAGDMRKFCMYATADQFFAVALGLQLDATAGNPEGRKFVDQAVRAIDLSTQVVFQAPWSVHKWLRFGMWRKFEQAWSGLRQDTEAMLERALTLEGANGFMHRFMRDQKFTTREEATEMCLLLLQGGSDTTSGAVMNILYQLARNTEAQATLREELKRELGGGDLDPDADLPYLDAVLAETYRLSPPLPLQKSVNSIQFDLDVHGYEIARGTSVAFCSVAVAQQVDEPHIFRPERFLGDGPKSRKGTPQAILDHAISKQVFGFGPRICVGARVAKLEIRSLLARLVQDYEFSVDEADCTDVKFVQKLTVTPHPMPPFRLRRIQGQ